MDEFAAAKLDPAALLVVVDTSGKNGSSTNVNSIVRGRYLKGRNLGCLSNPDSNLKQTVIDPDGLIPPISEGVTVSGSDVIGFLYSHVLQKPSLRSLIRLPSEVNKLNISCVRWYKSKSSTTTPPDNTRNLWKNDQGPPIGLNL